MDGPDPTTAAARARTGGDSGALRVWRVLLAADEADRRRLASLLSEDETSRARAFRFARHRRRFVVAHGALREILASERGEAPEALALAADRGGKPRLLRSPGGLDVRFNLSHSGDLALVAVAGAREVGVDVERLDRRVETERLSARFFAFEERAVLESLPAAERPEAFFRIWTLKEAYLKALGDGLGRALDSFAVGWDAGGRVRLLRDDEGEGSRWELRTLRPAPGYVGALAAEGGIPELECRPWPVGAPGAKPPIPQSSSR